MYYCVNYLVLDFFQGTQAETYYLGSRNEGLMVSCREGGEGRGRGGSGKVGDLMLSKTLNIQEPVYLLVESVKMIVFKIAYFVSYTLSIYSPKLKD